MSDASICVTNAAESRQTNFSMGEYIHIFDTARAVEMQSAVHFSRAPRHESWLFEISRDRGVPFNDLFNNYLMLI